MSAVSTYHVCMTVDNEPEQDPAGMGRKEPDIAFKAQCISQLDEEHNALDIVGVWLAEQDGL